MKPTAHEMSARNVSLLAWTLIRGIAVVLSRLLLAR